MLKAIAASAITIKKSGLRAESPNNRVYMKWVSFLNMLHEHHPQKEHIGVNKLF